MSPHARSAVPWPLEVEPGLVLSGTVIPSTCLNVPVIRHLQVI